MMYLRKRLGMDKGGGAATRFSARLRSETEPCSLAELLAAAAAGEPPPGFYCPAASVRPAPAAARQARPVSCILLPSPTPSHYDNVSGGGRLQQQQLNLRYHHPVAGSLEQPGNCGIVGCGNTLRSALSHESLMFSPGAPIPLGLPAEVRPVHPSLMPALPTGSAAFMVSGNADRVSRYFAAQSAEEARQWEDSLKKVNRPDLENVRHKENSLKLWIFEAKRLQPKKRYFCEICLNHILYARTTSKEKTGDADPFWGEPFEFSNLQEISLVTVKLFREADRKKKKDRNQLIGEVNLPVHQIVTQTEQWYILAPGPGQPAGKQQACPTIRLKSRFLSVDVLPLAWYGGLADFLLSHYCRVVRQLEPKLPVRMKEDLACGLVALGHSRGLSETVVADLLLQELAACEISDASAVVVFRGNSIATKSVEYYLKLVGSDYLRSVLSEPLATLLRSDESCEIDPVRVGSSAELESNQRSLRLFAELFWTRIYTSADRLPQEFGRLFANIRARSSQSLCDQLVGASIFLRFICPAILGPSLFGLCQELPGARVARSLTLIAKTVQNLANGASFGGKEAYMNFMNRFLEQHKPSMAQFLTRLQTVAEPGVQSQRGPAAPAESVDPGYELAQIHTLLTAALELVGKTEPAVLTGESQLAQLAGQLAVVSGCLKQNCPPPPQAPALVVSVPPPSGDRNNGDSNLRGAAPVSKPRRQQHQQQQHIQSAQTAALDWTRLPSTAAPVSAAAPAAAPATPASTMDSSLGYHTSSSRQQLAPTPQGGTSSSLPLQFHNPSYQKPLTDLQLPPIARPENSCYSSTTSESNNSSSATSSDDDNDDDDDDEVVHAAATITAETSSPDSRSDGSRGTPPQPPPPPPPPPLPPHRVRMGLGVVQQQQQQQQQQPPQSPPAYEVELHQLQVELGATRRQLEAAEVRLRANEREKQQLLADFRRGMDERQQREADNSRQLQDIMARLQALEADVRSNAAGTKLL